MIQPPEHGTGFVGHIDAGPGERGHDQAIMREILQELPAVEREAVARYYGAFESATHIESALGLAQGRLAEVRIELGKILPSARSLQVNLWPCGQMLEFAPVIITGQNWISRFKMFCRPQRRGAL